MDDIINQRQTPQEAPRPRKPRRWLLRILFGFLLLIAVGVCAFFWLVHNTRSQAPYSTALELIQNDPQLIEQVGQPIRDLRWLPTAGYPEQFQMQVEGPQGLADISVKAGQFDGNWELMAIDVLVREGSKRFSLEIGSGSGDAQLWTPPNAEAEDNGSSHIGLPSPTGTSIELPGGGPPDVEINLPEMPPTMDFQTPSIPPSPES